MTPLLIEAADSTLAVHPWPFYLWACEFQARIALRHLQRVWAHEDGPAGRQIWYSPEIDDLSLWSDLQGAMVAAITLSRFLRPEHGVRKRPGISQASAQTQADQRGEKLRTLLKVPDDSPLLAVKPVRDPLEHIDERIDGIVADNQVASVSDCYVVRGLEPGTTNQLQGVDPPPVWRHMPLRAFDPEMGTLTYDGATLDLFAYEVALCSLLAQVPNAVEVAIGERPAGKLVFGSVQLRRQPDDLITARRHEIDRCRAEISADGRLAMRLASPPGTLVFALDETQS